MYIVAIGWAYVILLMALTSGSLGKAIAIMAFLGLPPLLLLGYLGGRRRPRGRSMAMSDQMRHQHDAADSHAD